MLYVDAFDVPVVYVNSVGKLEHMLAVMGNLMKKHGFRMNGMSRIYAHKASPIDVGIAEVIGSDIDLSPKKWSKDIHFHREDILPGNWLFKHLILTPDTKKRNTFL